MSNPSYIKPKDFLDFAEKILNDYSCEPAYRTVINRSYLSAVLEAAKLLEPVLGEFSSTHEFYREVEDALGMRNANRCKDKLGTLRKWRSDADYDINKQTTKMIAKFALHAADDIFRLLPREIL